MRNISPEDASWMTMCTRYQKAPRTLWVKCFKHLNDPWCQAVALVQRDGGTSDDPEILNAVDRLNQWWEYCKRFPRK